jgi:hypothetical protein
MTFHRWILPCGLLALVSACGSGGESSPSIGGSPSTGGGSSGGSTSTNTEEGGSATTGTPLTPGQGGETATPASCSVDTDSCPDGSFCDGTACVQGCKAATDCQSGVCGADHNCERCQDDSECAEGNLCSSGSCLPACEEEGAECGDGRTCCGGRCVDTARDIDHCGACGGKGSEAVCSSDQFCGGGSCVPLTLAQICEHSEVLLVEDEYEADRSAGRILSKALTSQCPSKPEVTVVPLGEATASNPETGHPVAGPSKLVTLAGGPHGQIIARYLEDNSIPVVRHALVDGMFRFERIQDGKVLASLPWEESNDSRDIIVLELVREPKNGTTVFIVSGFSAAGTHAGAWYFANVMLPQIDQYTAPYYILDWTDGGDKTPDESDSFQVLASTQ